MLKYLLLILLTINIAHGASWQYQGIRHDITSTATAGGTTTLTNLSRQVQRFTGVTTQTLKLPAANTFSINGWWYVVKNNSTGAVTVVDDGSNTLATVAAGSWLLIYLADNSTANGVWALHSPGLSSVSLTADVTGVLPLANGGTNKNLTAVNGAVVYSDADSFELTAAGLSGQILQSAGAGAPTWSTPTYPSASGTAGQILRSDGTNILYSTATYPNTATAGDLLYGSASNVWSSLSIGSANALLGVNNGATAPEYKGVTATLAGALTAPGALRSNTSLILEDPGAGTNTVTIQSPTLGGSYTLTLPTTDGALNEVLTTDGNGVLSWSTSGSGGALNSYYMLDSPNGYGSTNTAIRRFSNVTKSNGTDITLTQSATLGDFFTINSAGEYCVNYSDRLSSASSSVVVTFNQATLTAFSTTASEIVCTGDSGGASVVSSCTGCAYMPASTVIRANCSAACDYTSSRGVFNIVRVQ